MAWSALASGLLIVALVAPGLSVLNSAVQLVRRSDARIGWFSGVLALLAATTALAVLIIHVFWQPVAPNPVASLAVLSVLELVVGGLLVLVFERRRASFSPDASYGLLTVGMGFFTFVVAFFVPLLPGQFSPSPSPALALTATPTSTHAPLRSATPTVTETALPPPTSTPSRTPTSLPTATPTRVPYSRPTPAPTATVIGHCGARVNYNLNLRALPSLDAAILIVIPYQSIIQVAGQNGDGTWWFVSYNDLWGWVDGQFISLDTDCLTAPVLLN